MKKTLLILSCLGAVNLGLGTLIGGPDSETDYYKPLPFGDQEPSRGADTFTTGKWWEATAEKKSGPVKQGPDWLKNRPRDKAMAFGIYTHDHGVLKIMGQCFPLFPDEPKIVSLEFQRNGQWEKVDEKKVLYPGWDVHFRVENWDDSQTVPYRLKLGDLSSFEGAIRKNPVDKKEIVVAVMSCNSPRDPNHDSRQEIVANLIKRDPDLLFFAGDQNYTHEEATYGWLQFGVQFGEVLKDRPTVCIPDDHDVGHGNLWGEGGKLNPKADSDQAGYAYSPEFVNMVQRQQTGNLPDPYDPTPALNGISVYYTDLNLGGISFAILEDRKFKSGPENVPQMGPRADHITDPKYDRNSIDLPGLQLVGDRQINFLDAWARDWTNADLKVVLSQTPFCGAVHIHGKDESRLLADLDSDGWPQTKRNQVLEKLRAVRASHLCGDQHLAVVVKDGIEVFRDGPFEFASPAVVNTIYPRWWHPPDEARGGGAPIRSPLPWLGDYRDGFGNLITMYAYANPGDLENPKDRSDGYGVAVFNKETGETTFECWPRFSDVSKGDQAQFEGWPVSFNAAENDGRTPIGHLKEIALPFANAVVELTDADTGKLIYCHRVKGKTFKAPVYAKGTYTLKAGRDIPEETLLFAERF